MRRSGTAVLALAAALFAPAASGATAASSPVLPPAPPAPSWPLKPPVSAAEKRAPLVMFTTMATWCAVCRGELRQIERLRRMIPASVLRIMAVPVDEKDTREKLDAYVEQNRPAYEMITDLSAGTRAAVKAWAEATFSIDALPVTVVTDADGGVLMKTLGVPTVSDLRRLLSRRRGLMPGPRLGSPAGSDSGAGERFLRRPPPG